MSETIPDGAALRASMDFVCQRIDKDSAAQAEQWAAWEARATDDEGYLTDWRGAPCTWEPYAELDYLGTNADPAAVNWRGVEERVTTIDPMELPDNAHWKGWVW